LHAFCLPSFSPSPQSATMPLFLPSLAIPQTGSSPRAMQLNSACVRSASVARMPCLLELRRRRWQNSWSLPRRDLYGICKFTVAASKVERNDDMMRAPLRAILPRVYLRGYLASGATRANCGQGDRAFSGGNSSVLNFRSVGKDPDGKPGTRRFSSINTASFSQSRRSVDI